MSHAYRDDQEVLRGKIRELRKQYLHDLFSLPPVYFDVYRKRFSRVWAGAAGVLGALVLAVFALLSMREPWSVNLVPVLLGAALFPWVAYLISLLFVGQVWLRRMMSFLYSGAEPHQLLVTLQSTSAEKNSREASERLEQLSVGLPLVALSLLAPLTLHLAFSLFVNSFFLKDFSQWILLSMYLVGHSHVILACYAWSYSRSLAKTQTCDFVTLSGKGWSTLWIVTGFSFFPGIIFSSGLVFLTGLFFIPAMFGWASWALSRERIAIEMA